MSAPKAKRSTLIILAGVVWSIVGLALIAVALNWMIASPAASAIPLAIGIMAGAVIYHFGFSKLVRINLERINALGPGKERVCIFAFQAWRSYLIIPIMMALGYTLRHLPLPRTQIAPIYLAIGLGLFLSSLIYYRRD